MSAFRFNARLAVKAIMVLGLAGVAPHRAAAQGVEDACPPWSELQTAVKARDLKLAAAAEWEIRGDCDARQAIAAKQAMLDLYRDQDTRMERAKAPPAERLGQLEAALKYTYGNGWHVWDIHAKIGDLRRKLPDAGGQLDHAKISLAYDRAVVAIDGAPKAERPATAAIGRLARLAYQFEALSPTPITRGGGFTRTARQINVGYVPAPLQFEYDKAVLTEAGKTQAQYLLKHLQDKRMPRVHLVGHTDPVGSHQYNDELSEHRAEAIKKFLVANGYAANKITTEGRGKRDIARLQIEDPEAFSETQIHQMLRRVELELKDLND